MAITERDRKQWKTWLRTERQDNLIFWAKFFAFVGAWVFIAWATRGL